MACFRRGDVTDALARLDALARTPSLSAADQDFLARQEAICRARLNGKSVASPAPVAAASDSRPIAAAQADCGPRALLLVCRQMGVPASLSALTAAAGTTGAGTNLAGLIRAAQSVHLMAAGVQMDGAALANLNLDLNHSALAWVDGNHYVAVLSVHGDTATIHDPNRGAEEEISLATGPSGLLERSGGILLLLSRSGGDGGKTLAAATTAAGTPL